MKIGPNSNQEQSHCWTAASGHHVQGRTTPPILSGDVAASINEKLYHVGAIVMGNPVQDCASVRSYSSDRSSLIQQLREDVPVPPSGSPIECSHSLYVDRVSERGVAFECSANRIFVSAFRCSNKIASPVFVLVVSPDVTFTE
jgi:hypothetical protein